jgi:hypothetical protein
MNTHSARSAMNNDPEVRAWVEQYLKDKERLAQPALSDEEFEKHWRYSKPELMHEGAAEGYAAYQNR